MSPRGRRGQQPVLVGLILAEIPQSPVQSQLPPSPQAAQQFSTWREAP